METVLPRAIGAPLGHPGRSLRCPRPPRTLRSRRARPDTHERPLLCGRRQRQLLCSRGAPAAEGVEARGGRGGGDQHVLHAIGSVASVGPNGRHAGSASAGRLCRRRRCAEPADRPVQARAGGPCLRRRSPGAGSRRHRRPRGRRHLAARRLFSSLSIGAARPQTSHMPHTPLTRFALFVQVACCGVSPPAALRLARAGTRRAARPRPRPCTQPPPSPQRAIPCRPSPYPPQPSAGLVSPHVPIKLLSSFQDHPCYIPVPVLAPVMHATSRLLILPPASSHTRHARDTPRGLTLHNTGGARGLHRMATKRESELRSPYSKTSTLVYCTVESVDRD